MASGSTARKASPKVAPMRNPCIRAFASSASKKAGDEMNVAGPSEAANWVL